MKSKFLAIFVLSSVLLFGSVSNVLAVENSITIESEENSISPRGEITEYKYKVVDGVMYKRLWSVTGNYWVDPYWTLA